MVDIDKVSVAKLNSSLQPYIDRLQRRLAWLGAGLIASGCWSAGQFSWWLMARCGAHPVRPGGQAMGAVAELPRYRGGEMAQLADAGGTHARNWKADYVERYVHLP